MKGPVYQKYQKSCQDSFSSWPFLTLFSFLNKCYIANIGHFSCWKQCEKKKVKIRSRQKAASRLKRSADFEISRLQISDAVWCVFQNLSFLTVFRRGLTCFSLAVRFTAVSLLPDPVPEVPSDPSSPLSSLPSVRQSPSPASDPNKAPPSSLHLPLCPPSPGSSLIHSCTQDLLLVRSLSVSGDMERYKTSTKNSVHRVSDEMWQGKSLLVVESVRACFMEEVSFRRALTDKQDLVSRQEMQKAWVLVRE